MILEKLILRNFGLFHGKQVLDLSPARRNGRVRPIVLLGGINGGGKTTVFDALQLALYGSRARCSKRASLSYDDFLLQSIHHGVPLDEGAGVALSFRHVSAGTPQDHEVRRDWRVEEGKLRETLLVLKDGLPNNGLTRTWPQLVEELIPLEISQLYFFDGEKIRALAEDATSSEALGAAVKTLLGLDIVERLITDAAILQTRLARLVGTPEQRAEAETLEQQLQRLRAELDAAQAERAALENRRLRAVNEALEAEETFAAMGGRHWDERHARDERMTELKSQAKQLEIQLVALAAGELPLALVADLLAEVELQDGRERTAAEAEVVGRLLKERDAELLRVLKASGVPRDLLALVREHLERDRQARRPAEATARRLALSDDAHSRLQHLRGHWLAELQDQGRDLLEQLAAVAQEREDLERALAATPQETDIGAAVDRVNAAARNLAQLEQQAEQLQTTLNSRRTELQAAEKLFESLWQGKAREEFEREDSIRMAQLAVRTRETMQEFLQRATARKIGRLSELITESFRFLLRKQSLVERIVIDPATFAVTLYDAAGNALPRRRLSEGEKQIFAIAMLWGLARASARPLPAVIDTPMARLDSAHRQNLVERYFPNASHQVVVLSTDTEVDRHFYHLLQPAVARAYHLNYDEQARQTVAEEGYFWKEDAGAGEKP